MSYLKKIGGRFSLSRLITNSKRCRSTTIEEITESKSPNYNHEKKKNYAVGLFIGKEELPVAQEPASLEPILHRDLKFLPRYTKPREAWVENFDNVKEEKRGLIKLHPEIFGTIPRLDMIYDNVKWQKLYKLVVSITSTMPAVFWNKN